MPYSMDIWSAESESQDEEGDDANDSSSMGEANAAKPIDQMTVRELMRLHVVPSLSG